MCLASCTSDEERLEYRLTPLTPDTLFQSDSFADAIRPKVQQVRQELFGNPHPPFNRYVDAVHWIEQRAAQQDSERERRNQAQPLQEEIRQKLREWCRLTGQDYLDLCVLVHTLPYAKEGRIDSKPVYGQSPLAFLGRETRRMAEATGFSQANVVAYVLADIAPLLAPNHITTNMRLNEFGHISHEYPSDVQHAYHREPDQNNVQRKFGSDTAPRKRSE